MPGVQIADLAGGALWGATAILGALVGRDRTGKGAHLDISMTEGALALLAAELGNLDCGARADARHRDAQRRRSPATASTAPQDDRYLAVGALEPKFWIALNQAIGRPPNVAELVGNPASSDARGELAAIFATKTAGRVERASSASSDCCVEVVARARRAAAPSAALARASVFFEIDGGDERRPRARRCARLSARRPTRPRRRASASTRARSSREYGFSDAEITGIVGV